MSKLYKVNCNCPTPLAANPFTVLAENEADAIATFKRRNGIVNTDHPIAAVETDGSEPESEQVLEEQPKPEVQQVTDKPEQVPKKPKK